MATCLRCCHLPCCCLHTQTAQDVVSKVVQELGRLDILVNNASVQHYCDDITDITPQQLAETFESNVFGYFFFAQASWRRPNRVSQFF